MTSTHHRLRRVAVVAVAGAALAATGSGLASSAAPAAPAQQGVPRLDIPEADTAYRVAGGDRYETAAEIAREFPAGATDTVVVASGTSFADALSGQVPAGAVGVAGALGLEQPDADGAGLPLPVLLTRAAALPGPTAQVLSELQPSTVVIVGGTTAVSPAVEAELADYADEVIRIGGENRYETSAAVAEQYEPGQEVVFVATGANFPDALAGGAWAIRLGAPVLLTDPDELRAPTANALEYLEPESVVVLGGPVAVSQPVVDDITELVPDTTRVAGANRYDTARIIAERYEKDNLGFLASGQTFPDALAGGALAGSLGAPLLLGTPEELPEETVAALDHLSPQAAVIFGGEVAIGPGVEAAVNAALPAWVDSLHVQLLSFNDFHGHLEVEGGQLDEDQDPEQNLVGGAVNLATTLDVLRTRYYDQQSLTVVPGDIIGGSTFLSGLFHDEPSIEAMESLGLDVASVGNHEFDEGVEELLRIQEGGCHPDDGCYIPEEPYDGADFPYLAANVVYKDSGEPILDPTWVTEVDGVPVGFIGMTLTGTTTLVSPGGISDVDFLDEVETADAYAAELQDQGVETIVLLLHEGGTVDGLFTGCENPQGPAFDIAEQLDPAVDIVLSAHTHEPYVCDVPDPDGNSRLVTQANQFGRVVTDVDLVVSRTSGDVVRDDTAAQNELVLESVPDDPDMAQVVAKWQALSEDRAGVVVGTVAEDITGDASGNRGIETPMANLVADSILFGTDGDEEGGAQISFMNVGGVRASLLVDQISNGEEPGEVTYEEAFNVAPFGNILVSVDLTGAQVKAVLEQQFDPDRGRQYLALGVSEGFTYTWDDSQPEGSKVSDMALDGVPLEDDTVYRVSTLNFLQEGGDSFTAFTEGTNLTGGPEDLANLVGYLEANPDLTAPEDRVAGL